MTRNLPTPFSSWPDVPSWHKLVCKMKKSSRLKWDLEMPDAKNLSDANKEMQRAERYHWLKWDLEMPDAKNQMQTNKCSELRDTTKNGISKCLMQKIWCKQINAASWEIPPICTTTPLEVGRVAAARTWGQKRRPKWRLVRSYVNPLQVEIMTRNLPTPFSSWPDVPSWHKLVCKMKKSSRLKWDLEMPDAKNLSDANKEMQRAERYHWLKWDLEMPDAKNQMQTNKCSELRDTTKNGISKCLMQKIWCKQINAASWEIPPICTTTPNHEVPWPHVQSHGKASTDMAAPTASWIHCWAPCLTNARVADWKMNTDCRIRNSA